MLAALVRHTSPPELLPIAAQNGQQKRRRLRQRNWSTSLFLFNLFISFQNQTTFQRIHEITNLKLALTLYISLMSLFYLFNLSFIAFLFKIHSVCEVWFCWGEFPNFCFSLCGGEANASLRRIAYRARAKGMPAKHDFSICICSCSKCFAMDVRECILVTPPILIHTLEFRHPFLNLSRCVESATPTRDMSHIVFAMLGQFSSYKSVLLD